MNRNNNNNNRPVWGANRPDPVATARRRAAVTAANNLPLPRQSNPIPDNRPQWNSRVVTEAQAATIARTQQAVADANTHARAPQNIADVVQAAPERPKWNSSTNARGSHHISAKSVAEVQRKLHAVDQANIQVLQIVQQQAIQPVDPLNEQPTMTHVWRVDRINSQRRHRNDPRIERMRRSVADANAYSKARRG